MNRIKLQLTILCLLFFCHGCAETVLENSRLNNSKLTNLENGICQQNTGLMWQIERSGKFSSFEEARIYVENLDLGGYSDWRLPTKNELYSLCDLFERKLAEACPLKSEGSYWSENGIKQTGEWHAYPLCGGTELGYLKSKIGRVRAVRQERPPQE